MTEQHRRELIEESFRRANTKQQKQTKLTGLIVAVSILTSIFHSFSCLTNILPKYGYSTGSVGNSIAELLIFFENEQESLLKEIEAMGEG